MAEEMRILRCLPGRVGGGWPKLGGEFALSPGLYTISVGFKTNICLPLFEYLPPLFSFLF